MNCFCLQLSEHDNPDFNDLVERIALIIEPETKTTGTFDEELKFLDVLFEQQTYYSFPGSLTTYPFRKCVTWLMYCDEPFPISSRQVKFKTSSLDCKKCAYNVVNYQSSPSHADATVLKTEPNLNSKALSK